MKSHKGEKQKRKSAFHEIGRKKYKEHKGKIESGSPMIKTQTNI